MKNLKKFITTLLVALMAFAAVPGSAFAASEYETKATGTLSLQKTLEFDTPQQAQLHGKQSFTFNAVYQSELSKKASGAEVPVPTVSEGSLSTQVDFNTTDFQNNSKTATQYASKFATLTFTKPGVYVYALSEVVPNPQAPNVTYDNGTRFIFFNVTNDDTAANQPALKLASTYFTTEQVTTDNIGEFTSETPTESKTELVEGTGPDFKNAYEDNNAQLKVSKTVTGNFGDKTKQFAFTVTFKNLPEGYQLPDPATETKPGEYFDKIGNPEISLNGQTYTIKLKDGESVNIKGLPVDEYYQVEESNPNKAPVSGYKTTYKVSNTTITNPESKEGLVAGANNDLQLVSGSNVVDFTNNNQTPPVTGFMMSMLPYVGILVIAGVAVALVMKRRSTSNF